MSLAGGFLQGLGGGMQMRQNRDMRKRELSAMEALGQQQGQHQAGGAVPRNPMGVADIAGIEQSGNVAFNNWMSNPDLARGIMETAADLGMDPLDLATIISYETAGTFDPTKRGPTTQWGQHRGLIQFGEPQAKQHGVNWDDPITSQLGPNGAVARYYRSSGWKPGMGLLDAYSIVNAGGPGRGNRTDANNGGAPGTVADKVNNQMAGHRAKAEAMLARHREAQPAPTHHQNSQRGKRPPPQTQPSRWGWAQQMMTGGAGR